MKKVIFFLGLILHCIPIRKLIGISLRSTLMIGILCYYFNIEDCICQQGWFIQQSSFPGIPQNLFFTNANTGWVMLDSGRIIRTTNGGTNWSVPYYLQSPYPINAIRFANELTGWAVGGASYTNPFSLEYCIIMKTTNGGINWSTQFTDSWGPRFYTLAIADSNYVFATAFGTDQSGFASYGRLKKTNTGGLSWSDDAISGLAMKSVYFLNSQTGWACSFAQSDLPTVIRVIYKTTNKGTNWTQVYKDTIQYGPYFNRLFFPDANTGYMIRGGYYYYMNYHFCRTTNSGYNWTALDSASTYGLSDLFFISSDTGWIIKNNIKRTNNGGLNWTTQSAPAAASKIFFVNSMTGWALGSVLMKTTTGGVTFVNRISNTVPDKFSLGQNYPNPFNSTTKIKFDIPQHTPYPLSRGERTILKVYDILGKEVQTLVNEQLQPGMYEVTFDGGNLPSGVYFYQLSTGEFIETKKLILTK